MSPSLWLTKVAEIGGKVERRARSGRPKDGQKMNKKVGLLLDTKTQKTISFFLFSVSLTSSFGPAGWAHEIPPTPEDVLSLFSRRSGA